MAYRQQSEPAAAFILKLQFLGWGSRSNVSQDLGSTSCVHIKLCVSLQKYVFRLCFEGFTFFLWDTFGCFVRFAFLFASAG